MALIGQYSTPESARMAIAERTQTPRRTGVRIATGWFDPPESIPKEDHDLWFEAVNEVQRTVGEPEVVVQEPGPLASQHSARALFRLTGLAEQMLHDAQEVSYCSNSSVRSDMGPTASFGPSGPGFVDNLDDGSMLTRNF